MPIEIEDLEAQAEAGLSISPGTQQSAALRVLVANPDLAFAPREIADAADIPAANAPTVCRRLVETGAAERANGHYYLTRDEETAAAVRRSLGSAHQQDAAQTTAAADDAVLGGERPTDEAASLSDRKVEEELAAMEETLEEH